MKKAAKILEYDEARTIVDVVTSEIRKRGKAAVVVVADSHGELVALARMDGALLSSILVGVNKAWTAARTRKPSAEVGKAVRDPASGFDISYYGDSRYIGWGGGVPLFRDGEVVGAVAVSGLVESEDIALAELGAANFGFG
jgi:glc operon protein GlcG